MNESLEQDKGLTPVPMKLGVIQPTRGLIFAEAQSALERELRELRKYRSTWEIYRSWDLKIPDCVNILIEEALADGCEYLLFNEEDTVIPRGGLYEMFIANQDIVAIDYGVQGWGCITRSKKTGEILWCGLGCTLVKAMVFENLEKPYFRADKQLLLNDWPAVTWVDAPPNAYGGHDIWFGIQVREKGFTITQVDGECKHLRLQNLGRPEVNNGIHNIGQKPVISNKQTI